MLQQQLGITTTAVPLLPLLLPPKGNLKSIPQNQLFPKFDQLFLFAFLQWQICYLSATETPKYPLVFLNHKIMPL
ncbi:hypothetical protein C7N43_34015 [Sphingobacteriales bacterium UPWRP_1]|nr:hypothetical protein C7N43_34015 [Sphingobacteriales bacterium UPWRP_1]